MKKNNYYLKKIRQGSTLMRRTVRIIVIKIAYEIKLMTVCVRRLRIMRETEGGHLCRFPQKVTIKIKKSVSNLITQKKLKKALIFEKNLIDISGL